MKKDSIYREVILNELANPITELQSVDEVIKGINSLEIEESSKESIVKNLKMTLGYE